MVAFADVAHQFAPSILTFGWLLVVWLIFWIAWKTYLLIKMIDYVSAIEWTYYEIKLPDETEETPKSMEVLYEYVGGIHKGPDFNEQYFDGYLEPWASFELYCTQQTVKYIIVVPTAHKRLFEGIVYGQYPKADIQEVEDYTLRYSYKDLRKKYEMWGTDVILSTDDIYPIKTYREFEASLAERVPFVDPMQIIVEALTNVEAGEEFWVQVLVRPLDASVIQAWENRGEKAIAKISGQAKKEKPGMWENFKNFMLAVPGEILTILFRGPLDFEKEKEEKVLRFFNPVDEAKMKGVLQKISGNGYKVKIRLIHIAPVGQLKKPNIARGFGVFKQFNAWHLNGFQPDKATRTNAPNFIFRDRRRLWRERSIMLNYQWRDFFGTDSGQMMNAEELATIYHFPVKYVSSPSVQRAKSGKVAPPADLPYA